MGVENHAGVFHPFDLTVRLLEVVVLLGKGKHIVQPAFDAKIEPAYPLVVQQPQLLVRLLADVGDGGIHIDHPAAGKVAVYQPVSYTHLDVYKRQRPSVLCNFVPLFCSPFYCSESFLKIKAWSNGPLP